jgi:hypothetical protein
MRAVLAGEALTVGVKCLPSQRLDGPNRSGHDVEPAQVSIGP